MISSRDEKHIDNIMSEIERLYRGLTKSRGRVLNYIGTTFNFEQLGRVVISIEGFIKDLLDDCREILGVSRTPADDNLFKIDHNSPLLKDKERERFHSLTAAVG